MSVYDRVKQAIIEKKIVVADYDGYRREMCPHVIGRKTGRAQALFYQFGGGSKSGLQQDGSAANWRCIPIEGLAHTQVVEGEWHTAPNHSRPQSCVDEIDVEVKF